MGNSLLQTRSFDEIEYETSAEEIEYGVSPLSWASSMPVRIGALVVVALAIGAALGITASKLTDDSISAELDTPATTVPTIEQDPGLSEALTPQPDAAGGSLLVIGDDGTADPTQVDGDATTGTSAVTSTTIEGGSTTSADVTTTTVAGATTSAAANAAGATSIAPSATAASAPGSTAAVRVTTTTAAVARTTAANAGTTATTASGAGGSGSGGNDGGSGNGGTTATTMADDGDGDGAGHGDDGGSGHGGHGAPTPGSWIKVSDESANYPDASIGTAHHIFNPYSSNAPAGWGASRIGFLVHCEPVMTKQIDPIVNPGAAQSAHLHEFFGNPNVTPNSTTQSLANTPVSQIDCTDKNDKSAYWSPTAYQNGQRVPADHFKAYYKSPKPNTVAMPFGLRMVAGNAGATKNQDRSVGWWQSSESDTTAGKSSMITKNSKGKVTLRINFPNCWDGKHLDSPDHQSHVAYARGGNCPSSHPVAIPQVVTFTDYKTNGGGTFSLSSGDWYTFHQDFWNVWSPDQMEALHRQCNLAEMNCRARRSPELVPLGQKMVTIKG